MVTAGYIDVEIIGMGGGVSFCMCKWAGHDGRNLERTVGGTIGGKIGSLGRVIWGSEESEMGKWKKVRWRWKRNGNGNGGGRMVEIVRWNIVVECDYQWVVISSVQQ